MKTWHIHISGLVQGVGFRPHVYRLAEEKGITGNICNSKDGVHIIFNADESSAREFYNTILKYPPPDAVITNHHFEQEPLQAFDSFGIVEDTSDREPDLLLTPDFAVCDNCRQEIKTIDNKRYNYAFTTCLHCGPRYSILNALPYERHNTSMAELSLCKDCLSEYNEVHNRRYYSQTNSCPDCAIPMHLYNNQGKLLSSDSDSILEQLNNVLEDGMIAAVKGIGGYLLLCDATNENAILTLRENKHRPAKPFALLYDSVDKARQDVFISINEEALLKDKSGPIVLCKLQPIQANKICKELIAPGLDKIGLMLPCSPLLQLIASAFKKPLIATSANISGSPIIYKDEEANESLQDIADFFLSYDREIMLPQDDSVIQLSKTGEKIILRRSRGLAPNYFPSPFEAVDTSVFAAGGELKSAFALQCKDRIYISQFLGNQETLASQNAYRHTFEHLSQLLQIKPSLVLADKHPEYHVTRFAEEMTLTEVSSVD